MVGATGHQAMRKEYGKNQEIPLQEKSYRHLGYDYEEHADLSYSQGLDSYFKEAEVRDLQEPRTAEPHRSSMPRSLSRVLGP